MGFYSWMTSDDNKSIKVGKKKRVYLLQPNGTDAIEESCYDGYGTFGTVDAHEWLAMQNLGPYLDVALDLIKNDSNLKLRSLGIVLDFCKYYKDEKTGINYADDYFAAKLFGMNYFSNYATKLFDGKDANQLIKDGTLKPFLFAELVGGIKYPLKFSYSEKAVYEELGASRRCPNQGFF